MCGGGLRCLVQEKRLAPNISDCPIYWSCNHHPSLQYPHSSPLMSLEPCVNAGLVHHSKHPNRPRAAKPAHFHMGESVQSDEDAQKSLSNIFVLCKL